MANFSRLKVQYFLRYEFIQQYGQDRQYGQLGLMYLQQNGQNKQYVQRGLRYLQQYGQNEQYGQGRPQAPPVVRIERTVWLGEASGTSSSTDRTNSTVRGALRYLQQYGQNEQYGQGRPQAPPVVRIERTVRLGEASGTSSSTDRTNSMVGGSQVSPVVRIERTVRLGGASGISSRMDRTNSMVGGSQVSPVVWIERTVRLAGSQVSSTDRMNSTSSTDRRFCQRTGRVELKGLGCPYLTLGNVHLRVNDPTKVPKNF